MNETPLVLFTTCVPAAVGLTACCAVFGDCSLAASVALVFASVGMAGSIFHLAKPLRAPTSLRGLWSSPLSQEIAAVVVFWVLLLAWLAAEGAASAEGAGLVVFDPGVARALPPAARACCVLAALWGLVLLCVINRAYRAPMRPAWNGPEGLGELAGIACGAGGSLYALLALAARVFPGAAFTSMAPASDVASVAVPGVAVMAVACVLGCVFVVACVLCPKQRIMRLQHMAADGDKRVLGALDAVDKEDRGLCRVLVFAVAGVASGLFATALGALFAAPTVAAICWGVAVVLQLAAAVELRVSFYRLPAPARGAWPLRK